MAAMNRNSFPRQLEEGLNAIFGMEYDSHETQYDKIFGEARTSGKAWEEDVLMMGLGGAQVVGEGAPVMYDAGAEGWSTRYIHVKIAHAFAITEEAIDDNLYGDLGAKYSRSMAKGMRYTKEVRGASVLNNGTSSSFPGGDGVELFSTAHPLMGGGTFANEPATQADLSEEALENALIDIDGFVDERGIPAAIKVRRMIVPRQLHWVASKILNTSTTPFTANLTTNELKRQSAIPEGCSVNQYLSDTDAWYLITDCQDGLKHFQRKKMKRGMEGDFETGNMRYKAYERYSFGWSNPRGAYSSTGV